MDTTLRDGEQTQGVSYSPLEKLHIAKLLLKDLKVDRIEVASARVSTGEFEALTTGDIVGPAVEAEDIAPGSLSLHPSSAATVRRLADLEVETLALMHGPAFTGDCREALLDLADDFDRRINSLTGS